MKTVVVYKSVTGFTKKYAQWIAEDLNTDLYNVKEIDIGKLLYYDLIIYGGSLHAVGISGVSIIKDNLDKLYDKKIIIYATGASPAREDILDEVKDANFTDDEQKQLQFFYLRGGFNYEKLDFINKMLMTMMKWKIKLTKPEKRTPDERGMLAAFDKPVDFTKKENLNELLNYARSLNHE
jgi:menaquinone-dependent protoporphyrinogen IX oxidase